MSTLLKLIEAIHAGNQKAVQKCLLSGVNPNGVADWAYVTPLHFATLYGHHQIAQ